MTNTATSQRKKSTTQQSRSNVANQQQSKKSTKQNQPSTPAASQSQKTSASVQASTDSPKPKSPAPSQAQAKQQQQLLPQIKEHVPLRGFNSDEIDALLSRGVDPQAEVYKSDHSQQQKAGPWGQKGTSTTYNNGDGY